MVYRRLVGCAVVAAVLLCLACPCSAQLAASGWPKFRGNIRSSGLSTYTGPTGDAFGWTFATGGAVTSSPAVGPDGAIYFTSQDQNLYALNPDGTERWRYDVNATSAASSPAIAADGTIYVGSDDWFVYAINPNGTLKWRKGLGAQIKSSPAIGSDGTIYVGTMNSKLWALNPDSTPRWTTAYSAGGPISSSPAIAADGTIYIGAQDAKLHAVNPDGTRKWLFSAYNWLESSPSIGPDGTIYIGSKDGRLYAVNPSGTQKWFYHIGVQVKSSPAVGPDGTIYVGADSSNVYAINPNGTKKWQYTTGGMVQSSPAVGSDGLIYVGSADNYLYALNADGTLLWRHSLAAPVYSSPAIGSDGSLYIGSNDRNLYTFSGDLTPPTTPVVTDDGAYSTSSNTLHASWTAEDPETGIIEYRYAIGTTPGGNSILDWTSAGAATEVTRTDLVIPNGSTCYVSVKAWNGAHLSSAVGTTDGILVDFTGPIISAVTDDGQFTTSASTVSASWAGADPESGVAEYHYCIGTVPGAGNTVPWTSAGLASAVTRSDLVLVSGATYYVSVRGRSIAGLWGGAATSDGITADHTPPPAPVVTDDGSYTSNNTALHASWSASDPESGIAEYQYAIGTTSGGTQVVGWTSAGGATEMTRTGLSLTDGVSYYMSVRARNRAGHWSNPGSSNGITVDASGPSAPVVTDDGDYTASSDTLHATWSAADIHSGVAEYHYAVGTSPGGTQLVDWTSTGPTAGVTRAGLSLANGVTYYISVKARNQAGVWSTSGTSDGIMAERTPPSAPVVTDDGIFTTDRTSLHATWSATDPESGVAEYQYAIGTTPGGTQTVGWTSTGSATQVTKTGLSLTDGVTYYISARARNRAGQWSDPGTSDGIVVDGSVPSTPVVTDDGGFTSSPDTLHAGWTAADPHSGVVEYQYAIGTTPGGTNVVTWTSAGTSNGVTRTGLSLAHGLTYYFSVKARNAAGLWSTVGSSNGILVDRTGPNAPTVTDDGDYSGSNTTLHASWTATDPESGIGDYEYAIGTSPGAINVSGWTYAGSSTQVTRSGLSLTDGATYYFSVRARNQAGLWGSVGSSNGIVVDGSAPSVPSVTDDGVYTASPDTLHAVWSASDPHTGVAEYQYAIGTSPGATNTVGWTSTGAAASVTRSGLSLANGVTYYISVKAKNQAGVWSTDGTSDGITIERTPPTVPAVIDDGTHTSVTTTLHASWSAIDPESGVVEYQYAIGTSPGGTQVVGWTLVGNTTEVTKTGLSLVEGTTYYFAVRARNGVLLWSDAGTSDGIRLDLTPPTAPAVIDDGEFTSSFDMLSASWMASDAQSGIGEYQYAIGTTIGGTDVLGWTSAGAATEITRTGMMLIEGKTYYFSAKAKNTAGLWGPAGNSDGITVVGSSAWPQFRADANHRGATSHKGCQTGAALWEFPTTGWVESSAAIGGDGTIYFGSGDGALYAVNRNGVLQWKYQTGGSVDSSPAIGDNGRVYFGSYDGYLYCLNPNGSLRWRYPTEDMIWSSPVIGPDEIIYFGGHDGSLYALRPDGTLKWKCTPPGGGSIWSSPALSDAGVLYFGCNNGDVCAVYASNGAIKWRFTTGSAVDSSPMVGPDGTIYAGSGDGYFYAINPNGTLKWAFLTEWATDSSAAIGPDGTIYFGIGSDWSYGVLYAVNANGSLKWTFDAHGAVRSSPAVDSEGNVYFGSGDGNVYVVDAQGNLKWNVDTGWAVLSSPAIGKDGMVCVGSYNGSMYAFKDSDSGDLTKPTKPVVIDEGAVTFSTTMLTAAWASSDPESGIAEYLYALGTQPGAADIVPWTSASTATSTTCVGLNLNLGSACYFSVKSRNGARIWSLVGVSDGIVPVIPGTQINIAQAKVLPDDEPVYITGAVVTARFADAFYIEETSRLAGIKVIPNGQSIPEIGRLVTVIGVMTTENGERAIRLTTVHTGGSASIPKPLGMPNRLLGGGPPAPSMPAVQGGAGVNNVGSLVATWGHVVSTGPDFFYINDGSYVHDPSGGIGVKVSTANLAAGSQIPVPAIGALVRVTGALSTEAALTGYRRLLRPRHEFDIKLLQ